MFQLIQVFSYNMGRLVAWTAELQFKKWRELGELQKFFLGDLKKKLQKVLKKRRRHSAGIEQKIKTLRVSLSLSLSLSH